MVRELKSKLQTFTLNSETHLYVVQFNLHKDLDGFIVHELQLLSLNDYLTQRAKCTTSTKAGLFRQVTANIHIKLVNSCTLQEPSACTIHLLAIILHLKRLCSYLQHLHCVEEVTDFLSSSTSKHQYKKPKDV